MIDEIDTVSVADKFDIWHEISPEEYARILIHSWGKDAFSVLAERLAKAISDNDQGRSSFLEAVNAAIARNPVSE